MAKRLSVVARLLAAGGLLAGTVAGCQFHVNGVPVTTKSQPNDYVCLCHCDGSTRSITVPVSASSDDAEELVSTGAVLLTGQFLDMTQVNAGQQVVGLRFANLGIPRGSQILSAKVQFTTAQVFNVATTLAIHGEADDDAATFTTANFNVSGRSPTVAVVPWTPGTWTTVGEAGPAELTPDLSSIVTEITGRNGWAPANALVLVVSGTGHRAAVSFDNDPAQAPRLEVSYVEPALVLAPHVCMPDNLNPNLGTNPTPTYAQLDADCSGRVQTGITDMAAACNLPSACTCNANFGFVDFSATCDQPCAEVPLDPTCSNFDPVTRNATATNAPGDPPVCTATSPLGASIFGRASTCEVSGQASVTVGGDSASSAASGEVSLTTVPCTGGTCVGIKYGLGLAPITFGNAFGSATFEDLAAVGESSSGSEAALDASGNGVFGPNATQTSGRGRRGSDTLGVVATNSDVIDVGVTLTPGAAICSLSGSLIGSADPELKRCENGSGTASLACQSDADCANDAACTTSDPCTCTSTGSTNMTLGMSLQGPIVNQPPSADAGADQVVECNLPGQASFTLDGSRSSDPDGNIASFTWLTGSRAGPVVGFTPRPTVQQALGTQVSYVLRVLDTYGQLDEATTSAQVVDTTPPVIACNAPAIITPPSAPVSFTASASDVCDPQPATVLTGFQCFKITNKGRVVNKGDSCVVSLSGPTITITDSGGVGDNIVWTVRATDASGNASTATCAVLVVRP